VRWRWGVGTPRSPFASFCFRHLQLPHPHLVPLPFTHLERPRPNADTELSTILTFPLSHFPHRAMAVIDPNADGDNGSPHMEGPTITRQGVEARIKDLLAAGVKERYERRKGWSGGRREGRRRAEGREGRREESTSSSREAKVKEPRAAGLKGQGGSGETRHNLPTFLSVALDSLNMVVVVWCVCLV